VFTGDTILFKFASDFAIGEFFNNTFRETGAESSGDPLGKLRIAIASQEHEIRLCAAILSAANRHALARSPVRVIFRAIALFGVS